MRVASAVQADVTPMTRRSRRKWTGWLFVAPFMVVFLLVLVAPIIYSIYISTYRTTLIGGTRFVGAANYLTALSDPKFWDGVIRVLTFMSIQLPIMLGLALVAALALDSARLRFVPVYRLGIFLPYAVPGVVAVMIWGYIYGSQFGLVADLNRAFGLGLPSLLASNTILGSIINIQTWEYVGYNMLIFFAALKGVPNELYEAAEIDGASTLRTVISIKIPLIRGAILVATIFSIIGSLQLFNEPAILSVLAPGVISSYFTPNLYAYSLAFAGTQFDYSAAIAIIAGLITMIIAYIAQLVGNREERA